MLITPEVRPPTLEQIDNAKNKRDKAELSRLRKKLALERKGQPVPTELQQPLPPVEFPVPTLLPTDNYLLDVYKIRFLVEVALASVLAVAGAVAITELLVNGYQEDVMRRLIVLGLIGMLVSIPAAKHQAAFYQLERELRDKT
jgi:hypothetical protein